MQQCAEGWHRDTEPDCADDADSDEGDDARRRPGRRRQRSSTTGSRRVRSTRRRPDAPDLPRVPMEDRTVGRSFTAPDGGTYRPSMFLTLTLPSYGTVRAGAPVDPDTYDYRRAALGCVALPEAGRPVLAEPAPLRRLQGAVLRRRRTPTPARAAPPRRDPRRDPPRRCSSRSSRPPTCRCGGPPSTSPSTSTAPRWDGDDYVDPDTGELLPTWEEALDQADPDAARRM